MKQTYYGNVNQCAECSDINDVWVNFNIRPVTAKQYEIIENEIKYKYAVGGKEAVHNAWPAPEYNRISKNHFNEEQITIKTRKFNFEAKVTSHKCSRCD